MGSIFGGPLNRNDRPRGGFPESMTTNETTIRRAQELLVEFGDILWKKDCSNPSTSIKNPPIICLPEGKVRLSHIFCHSACNK